ncbi:beta-lactamase superfamily domain-containing protein [Triangularia verruculosa]|uniref:Beta-lactamase superfamily domain-containing protein n=1 Tax=Triangularia verruculosa TaxID=2587418 RepID=A0AAN6X5H4_9PEZI|nr:beta-lactamase superfamily domain-containing protein [Triangularia verruculosa]
MLDISPITSLPGLEKPSKHHVLAPSSTTAKGSGSAWSSYFPALTFGGPSQEEVAHEGHISTIDKKKQLDQKREIIGFQNPWPSWHKPSKSEKLASLQWGPDTDPCIPLAASYPLPSDPVPAISQPNFSAGDLSDSASAASEAAKLLSVQKPDFSPCPAGNKAKVTWLGHASMLLQLPSGINVLFDPIFSQRCFPSENFGPIRTYQPPCQVGDLPGIDAVVISHNHYDHLDQESVMGVWKKSKERVRFFVPLGIGKMMVDLWGLPKENVVEMDWWDSVTLTGSDQQKVKVWCTPAQHNCWRSGSGKAGEPNGSLWASWMVEDLVQREAPYRVFFGGDTGYQFHSDPTWPPSPPSTWKRGDPLPPAEEAKPEQYPACPAFREISERIGSPDLSLLPISVGASFAYLRSFTTWLPDWGNPMPRHTQGVTGANHMPPWDAVKVFNEMTDGMNGKAVAIGLHWGTFATEPEEVLKTLGGLEWACLRQGVAFGRGWEGKHDADVGGKTFLAVNQGESVLV